jgi:hypothetical protein
MHRLSATVAIALCAALFAGCSGGGAHSSSLPAVKAASGKSSQLTMTVRRLLTTNAQVLAANKRSTRSFSAPALGLKIDVLDANSTQISTATFDLANLELNTQQCFQQSGIYTNCTLNVTAPSTSAKVRVTVCPDAACAQPFLDQGLVTLTNFVAGQANTVIVTMQGVPASVTVFAQNPAPLSGAGQVPIPLVVQVFDAEGAAILGPDAYNPTPVTVTESNSSHTTLSVQAVLSLDQQAANGQGGAATPVPLPTPVQTPGPSVSIANRYVQPVLTFDGTGTAPTTITATIGNISSPGLVITPTLTSPITASAGTLVTLGGSVIAVSTSSDAANNVWVRYSAGSANTSGLQQLDPTTFATIGAVFLPPTGTVVTGVWINGPDGGFWSTYCSGTTDGCGAAGFIRFDTSGHNYTFFPATTGVQIGQPVNTGTSLLAPDQAHSAIAVLPFTGSLATTASEVAWSPPPATASLQLAFIPAPQTIEPTGHNNKFWVVENNSTAFAQTYVAQVDVSGNKMPTTELKVSPGSSTVEYFAVAAPNMSAGTLSSTITFTDNVTNGELYNFNTTTGGLTQFSASANLGVVPVPGSSFGVYDSFGNYWYLTMDGFQSSKAMNRVDVNTGRTDTLGIQLSNFADDVTLVGSTVIVSGLNNGVSSLFTFAVPSPP